MERYDYDINNLQGFKWGLESSPGITKKEMQAWCRDKRGHVKKETWIKGPDKNPTRQLLPIMSTRCCSGDGEGRKDKEGGGGSRSKTKLWVRRREAGGGGEEPGIQNQKQEPHTKMWGITAFHIFHILSRKHRCDMMWPLWDQAL